MIRKLSIRAILVLSALAIPLGCSDNTSTVEQDASRNGTSDAATDDRSRPVADNDTQRAKRHIEEAKAEEAERERNRHRPVRRPIRQRSVVDQPAVGR